MQKIYHSYLEVGTDEAGRGCLAGPVTAAAVVLPEDFNHHLLNDSKQMNEKNRNIVREYIQKNALDYAVCHIWADEIDQINILNASILAMQKAISALKINYEFILVDGNRFKAFNEIPFECMIKGDARFMRIAAASVLAKTSRDELMEKLDLEFPEYNWKKNKGYPTKDHREAILKHGFCKYHRKTFKVKEVISV